MISFAVATSTWAGEVSGTVSTKRVKELKDVVVYLESKEAVKAAKPPKEPVVMDQRKLTFIPHVLPIIKGTTVDFLNSDDFKHNVFTPDKIADRFNLGTYPSGQSARYTFTKPGDVVTLCNVHPEMEAYVVVLETPYFTKIKEDGTFSIVDVPAGSYTLKTWHEKLKPTEQKVTVPDQESLVIDIELKK